jgi:putative SOS response-associated peptidase YedK
MCGRYALYETKDLGPRFNLATKPTFVSKDNYNVAPRQRLPVVYTDPEKGRVAEPMQWGLLPFFARDPRQRFRPINTVSETAFDTPMWREAVKHHRCLVPTRGFYEWQKFYGDNGKVERKVPYFIHPKRMGLFSFAGIYSIWKDVEGLPLYTFSIMTTGPNKEMRPIHDRMPVILHPDQEALWLDPQYSERSQLADLLFPYEDNGLEIYKVSEDVNSTRNNNPHLVEAVAA